MEQNPEELNGSEHQPTRQEELADPELYEDLIPMSPEEVADTLRVIEEQLAGMRLRLAELAGATSLLELKGKGESEEAQNLKAEMEEFSDQVAGLEDHLQTLRTEHRAFIRKPRIFRRYTKSEAADEASVLKNLVDSGVAASYTEAERNLAERMVEDLLQQGKGWEAIRIGVESKFIGDDIVMDALDSVEQFMGRARDAGDTVEYERLQAELRRIEEWRRL